MKKYCDNCVYFLQKSLRCKAFGIHQDKKVSYYPIEYVRQINHLCGEDAVAFIDKDDALKLRYFQKFKKRLQ